MEKDDSNKDIRSLAGDLAARLDKIRDCQPKVTSFANILSNDKPIKKINFRTFRSAEQLEDTDFVLPIEAISVVKNKFANSLVGFFVGKSVAFPLVQNYVTNMWAKFGFQRVMRDNDEFFYFKFASLTGLEQVLEQGSWLIRNAPLILNKWTPDMALTKDNVTKVPMWDKIHKVPVVAYTEDGLSLIGTQIITPRVLGQCTTLIKLLFILFFLYCTRLFLMEIVKLNRVSKK
ncbi:retrovirus-related pol polyprotein from transposon TNT 1-94 [Tanacetum coccineum]